MWVDQLFEGIIRRFFVPGNSPAGLSIPLQTLSEAMKQASLFKNLMFQ
jgi:hypothetical protein